ncbi:MAG: ImmA/IrrE family metallo-endopeptidase [Lachnospiraceae bacterium]|nr:ImmA/IrrE family metallo-endopeptidase [Lachnospiraceae bacterium]
MAYNVSAEKRAEWKNKANENADKAKELILSISKNYIQNTDSIAEVLKFASNFYQYSINNTELIYAQNPRASFVKSYEGWKKENAQVLKGEIGMKIWVPVKTTFLILSENNYVALSDATDAQKAAYKNGLIESRTRTTFKIGTVFDIGQTNYPKERYPELYSMGYNSEQHETVVNGLIKFCQECGCPVETRSLSSISLRGTYDATTNSICINEKLEDTQRLSTLAHEIGHMLQKHGSTDATLSQKEFEADCIAVLIQSHFGIELNDARKSHLSYHFKNFEAELQKTDPSVKEEDVIKQIEGVLDMSMKVFRQFVEQMEQHVKLEIDKLPIAVTPENKPLLTFYYQVNECEEFPSMGKSHSMITNASEALDIYKNIPEDRKSLVAGIDVIGVDTTGNVLEEIPISGGKIIDLSLLDHYPAAKENSVANKKIKEIVDVAKQNGFQTYGNFNFNNEIEQQNRRHRAGR